MWSLSSSHPNRQPRRPTPLSVTPRTVSAWTAAAAVEPRKAREGSAVWGRSVGSLQRMSISSKSSAVVPSCEIDSGLRAPPVDNRQPHVPGCSAQREAHSTAPRPAGGGRRASAARGSGRCRQARRRGRRAGTGSGRQRVPRAAAPHHPLIARQREKARATQAPPSHSTHTKHTHMHAHTHTRTQKHTRKHTEAHTRTPPSSPCSLTSTRTLDYANPLARRGQPRSRCRRRRHGTHTPIEDGIALLPALLPNVHAQPLHALRLEAIPTNATRVPHAQSPPFGSVAERRPASARLGPRSVENAQPRAPPC